MKKIKLKISGMHCASCAMNIDGELEDTEGVVESSTSYKNQETEVEFDDMKVNPQQIVEIVKNTGYLAEVK